MYIDQNDRLNTLLESQKLNEKLSKYFDEQEALISQSGQGEGDSHYVTEPECITEKESLIQVS